MLLVVLALCTALAAAADTNATTPSPPAAASPSGSGVDATLTPPPQPSPSADPYLDPLAVFHGSTQFSDEYAVAWVIDTVNGTAEFTLNVTTLNWIGFGIGEEGSGSMPGADMFVFSATDFADLDAFSLTDRYSLGFFEPAVDDDDESQWTLVSAERDAAAGRTVLTVRRPLGVGASCNGQDRSIPPGKTNIVGAFGLSPVLSYHVSSRWLRTVVFYDYDGSSGDVAITYPETNVTLTDLRMTAVPASNASTSYWCQSMAVPDYGAPAHIIALELLFNSVDERTDERIHHATLRRCWGENDAFAAYASPARCDQEYTSETDTSKRGCTEVVATFAPGSFSFDYPDVAGIRSSHDDPAESAVFMLLEVHIDNPARIPDLVLDAGVRLHTTTDLREHDMGVLKLGDVNLSFDPLAPGEPAVHYESVCPGWCTQAAFTGPIHVFATGLHMHTLGSKGWLSVERFEEREDEDDFDFREPEEISRTEFFNFGLQRFVDTETIVRRGDRLHVHFVWDTTSKTEPTPIGEDSDAEMGLLLLLFWPREHSRIDQCGNQGTKTMCGGLRVPLAPNLGTWAQGETDIATRFGESCPTPVVITGRVYFDENSNRVRDDGEVLLTRLNLRIRGPAGAITDIRVKDDPNFDVTVPTGRDYSIVARVSKKGITRVVIVNIGEITGSRDVEIGVAPTSDPVQTYDLGL